MVIRASASSKHERSPRNGDSLVLVSHCLLNQGTRAGGSLTPEATPSLLRLLSTYNLQVYQLPCPEYLFMGIRDKRTQDSWERVPGFVQFVRGLADSLMKAVKPLLGDVPVPLIGIARSPCCSLTRVYRGDRLVCGRGLWVKELEERMPLDMVEFDYKMIEQSLCAVEQILCKRAAPT